MHFRKLQVAAVAGIAIFNVPMYFMQPSIMITSALGAPYSDDTTRTELISECCPLVWEAQTATNEKTLSEMFHTYRKHSARHPRLKIIISSRIDVPFAIYVTVYLSLTLSMPHLFHRR